MRRALVAALALVSVGCTNCAAQKAESRTPSFGIHFHDPFDPKEVYACGQLQEGTLDCMRIERFEAAQLEAQQDPGRDL